MCEIFIIDPAENEAQLIEDNAYDMFKDNPDGIGLVAVHRNEEEGKFEYDHYKCPEYKSDEVMAFIEDTKDAWRLVVHARLATHGDTDLPQTHPISHECDMCDIEMVVHNGVVNAEETWRQTLKDEGHDFNTFVDSEVILHEHGSLPTDIEELEKPDLRGSLNYILFQEDALLVRSSRRYRHTTNLKMGKYRRCEWDDQSKEKVFLLATPDGDVQETSISSTSTTSSTAGYYGRWSGYGGGSQSGSSRSRSRSTSRSNSGSSGGNLGEDPQAVYSDWEDWPPQHLASVQED